MATKLSKSVKNRPNVTMPQMAGSVHCAILKHTFNEALLAADTLEIGALPNGCQLIKAVLMAENVVADTLDVGFLAGVYGDDTTDRVVGSELFNAALDDVKTTLDEIDAAAIATSDAIRGIGVQLSADEAAASNKTITLVIYYTA